MKFIKIVSFLIFIILTLSIMTGCRCVPSSEKWFFYSYRKDMVFLNNVTLNLGFSDASHSYPFAGAASQNIGISFSEDGKVEFTDMDGITHHGTYTYEHVKNNYTNFTITLENGEIIEGSSIKSGKNKKLSLTYKEVIYNFSTTNKRSSETMDSVIQEIISGNIGPLTDVTVVKTENGHSVFFSEMISYPIRETTAVFSVRINQDGTYKVLDKILEGEALSIYDNSADYIVIYYIEK